MCSTGQENRFGSQGSSSVVWRDCRRGFTLIELLVVLGVISLLMGVLLPALGRARRQARMLVSTGNLRQITAAVDAFASDRDGRYPPSVATIGTDENWSWQGPFMLTAYRKRSPSLHRSVSAYLHAYIADAAVMFCPNAPRAHRSLQAAWDAGDDWDDPLTPDPDALFGVYCFYWNYSGCLGEEQGSFRGPSGPARGYREGRIVVTDYFGYGLWRSPGSYGSCERFRDADVTEGTSYSSAYWSTPGLGDSDELRRFAVKLHAGYTDGHVESHCPAETVPMGVIRNRQTGEPYPAGTQSQGTFYLPRIGLH